ncbi:hypothetical protein FHS78_002843 [Parvibaculum indicum]|nr:hypothetical protein [Parvibaculum indicum]
MPVRLQSSFTSTHPSRNLPAFGLHCSTFGNSERLIRSQTTQSPRPGRRAMRILFCLLTTDPGMKDCDREVAVSRPPSHLPSRRRNIGFPPACVRCAPIFRITQSPPRVRPTLREGRRRHLPAGGPFPVFPASAGAPVPTGGGVFRAFPAEPGPYSWPYPRHPKTPKKRPRRRRKKRHRARTLSGGLSPLCSATNGASGAACPLSIRAGFSKPSCRSS